MEKCCDGREALRADIEKARRRETIAYSETGKSGGQGRVAHAAQRTPPLTKLAAPTLTGDCRAVPWLASSG
jgi:hypothetical protein